MITKRSGDLLELAEKGEVDVIVHQANIYNTFGAGIARGIKEKFPYAAERDAVTVSGDETKIGGYTIASPSPYKGPVVVNLYSQRGLGPSHTSYDAMYQGLSRLNAAVQAFHPKGKEAKIGIPYGIGCGIADGNWTIVQAIITAIFEDSPLEVVIVKLPEVK